MDYFYSHIISTHYLFCTVTFFNWRDCYIKDEEDQCFPMTEPEPLTTVNVKVLYNIYIGIIPHFVFYLMSMHMSKNVLLLRWTIFSLKRILVLQAVWHWIRMTLFRRKGSLVSKACYMFTGIGHLVKWLVN